MNKFDWKGYYAPTPAIFRKIGDSILGFTTMISGFVASMEVQYKEWILLGLTITGAAGKFLTNFFVEDNVNPPNNTPVEPMESKQP